MVFVKFPLLKLKFLYLTYINYHIIVQSINGRNNKDSS